jgi:hypothetical protein
MLAWSVLCLPPRDSAVELMLGCGIGVRGKANGPHHLGCVAVAFIGLGVCMVVWPAWVVLKSRDEAANRPVPLGRLGAMRLVGVGIILAAATACPPC